ncbi:hypothetical protein ACFLVX_05540 [Chloroflexota bacterium]
MELLKNSEEALRSLGRVRTHYISYATKFLIFASGTPLDRKVVEKHLQHLRKEGYSDDTINFAFRVIRRLFVANNLPWDFRRGEAPEIRESEVFALDPDDIAEMIRAKDRLTPQESALLALYTTYGLRRTELAAITPRELDMKSNAISVALFIWLQSWKF